MARCKNANKFMRSDYENIPLTSLFGVRVNGVFVVVVAIFSFFASRLPQILGF